MAQTAHNGRMILPTDTWVLISEINCTYAFEGNSTHAYEILVADKTAAPAPDQTGISYPAGFGEDASVDTLGRFPGAAVATGIFAISRHNAGAIFVSRAEVA